MHIAGALIADCQAIHLSAGGHVVVQGVLIDVDEMNGRAVAIRRIRERVLL